MVEHPAAVTSRLFNEHVMAIADEHAYPFGSDPDTIFINFSLFGDANNHSAEGFRLKVVGGSLTCTVNVFENAFGYSPGIVSVSDGSPNDQIVRSVCDGLSRSCNAFLIIVIDA